MAFADRVSTQDFTFAFSEAGGPSAPFGLWSDGITMWVSDSGDDKLYAYNLSTKLRDAAKDFDTLSGAGNNSPRGLWSDGATMWVSDSGDTKIYAYNLSTKLRDGAKDFDTLSGAGNNSPRGVWSDGATMWVSDGVDDKLYAYNLSTKAHDGAKDFDTLSGAGNNDPRGLWSDGATMWVSDDEDDKLYAYNLSTKLRDAAKDFDTLSGAGNNSPFGVWSDGATMWVSDDEDDKLYAYELASVPDAPAAPSVTSTGTTSISATFAAASTGDAATSLDLRWRAGTSGAWTEIIGVTSPHTVSGLDPATLHQVEVRGVNGAGDGDWSDTGSATTDTADLMPTIGVLADSNVEQGTALSRPLPAATGGDLPITYSVTGRPSGMTFNPSTRVLAWPAQTSTSEHELTYIAEDTDGDMATRTFTVRALLALDNFDDSGLVTDVLVLIHTGSNGDNAVWGRGPRFVTGSSIIDGEIDIASDTEPINQIRFRDDSGGLGSQLISFHDDGPVNLGDYFETGAGADLSITIQTGTGSSEIATWTIASSYNRGGSNFVIFDVPVADQALIADIETGDRFLLALTREATLAAEANASFGVGLAVAAPAELQILPLAAEANASFGVGLAVAAEAELGDLPSLDAEAGASFGVGLAVAAPAGRKGGKGAVAAGASFGVGLAVAAPAALGALVAEPEQPPAPTFDEINATSLVIAFTRAAAGGRPEEFDLRWREGTSGAYTVINDVTSPHTVTGLTEGNSYQVQVRAINSRATSMWSETASEMLVAPVQADIPIFRVISPVSVEVKWRPDMRAEHYGLRYRNFPAAWTTVADLETNAYVISDAAPQIEYEFQVMSENGVGEGDWSEYGFVTLPAARVAPDVRERSSLLIGQYEGAVNLRALLSGVLGLYQDQFMAPLFSLGELADLFLSYGDWLDFIGERLGLSRPYILGTSVRYFGFGSDTDRGTWDEVPLYDLEQALDDLRPLDDDRYRSLLRGRGLSLRLGTSVPDIEAVAAAVFTFGGYVVDSAGALTLYVEDDRDDMAELAGNAGVVPRPAGIPLTIEEI